MLSTCRSVTAAPVRAGAEPGAGCQSSGHRGGQSAEERRQGLGVQEWHDGSRYEGEFVNGLKHGKGKYTWRNGECYEGSFYKDYKHGDAVYSWPTGHKFIGKFYLNRREGYGQQVFPDGDTFHGLYHLDKRFGPGLVSYSDGRVDVGLWHGARLLKLCTSVEEGFSLKNFPEYAAYMEPAASPDSLTQPPFSDRHSGSRTSYKVDTDMDLLLDENFILPPGIESYSTDGDHLPLPPGRRRELDQCFFGELWEPDAHVYQGYERDPLSTLPLQARMEAHIHKHRRLAENVDWDVAAVLSLNREGFGPKGPLEVKSELLIQHASRGELRAVSKIIQTGLVHPDVVDSQGHSALMAATVNCHKHVIHLLLDVGVDIDKLNSEGMSALALCHVLYYPFQSLHNTLTEPPPKTKVSRSPSLRTNSPKVSQVDLTTDIPRLNKRPQTTSTTLSSKTDQSHISDKTVEGLTERTLQHSGELSNDNELIAERRTGLNEPETPSGAEHPQEEWESKEKEGAETDRDGQVREREDGRKREDEKESKEEERKIESRWDQMWGNGESDLKLLEKEGETQSRKQEEEDVERRESDYQGEDLKDGGSEDVPGAERSIQVMDGHITLGSVPWKSRCAKAAGGIQAKDKEVTEKQAFDSARAVSSYKIQVTEEVMQHSAEALSRTGIPQSSDTQETVRKMAAMKIEHRVRLSTLKLLLERGADPNASKVPMPVLFLAIMAADTEAVRRLLLCGARTDIPLPPERKGLYPLHVAAALPGPAGPRITELLLHAITDPDAQACDSNEIFEPDKIFDNAQEELSTSENPHLKEGGRTALHVACQRDSDYENASKVVALLLSHHASTDLLWSGHSPLSLAIASGNDLAVEELLKGGANPNIPLGRRVGSALCALANINYHLGGNRAKLLDMLAKAGADILMPVTVGDVSGTAVDYAYYSFNQDLRIANTPFHALNMRERETFKARHQLLRMMRDLLRQTAGQRERDSQESEQQLSLNRCESLPAITEKQRKPAFKFCYHCGRSVSVKLTSCSRCHMVFYCSKNCKLQAWDERHRDECIRVSASAVGNQKSVVFKSQRGPRPLTAKSKSKTVTRPLSVKVKSKAVSTPLGVMLKSQRGPEPLSIAANILESHVNLKENYSHN